MSPFSLAGKTALVTGAYTGFGQGIAIAMAEAGAHVLCAGRRSCVDTVKVINGQAQDMILDFADRMVAKDLFAAQTIDISINNVGIIRRDDAATSTVGDWHDVISINLRALFFTSQSFAQSVSERQATGKIANIASLLSFRGGIRGPSYTASKHAVAGLTKAPCNEWAATGINVSAIAPGYIKTSNTEDLLADPVRNTTIVERIPAGRWGETTDIAQSAVFLAATASDYIYGAVLNLDGGWVAR